MPLVLDILFVLIAAIFILVGVRRGFIKSLIQSAKLLLSIVAMYFLGSHTATFLRDKFIFKGVYDFVYGKVDGLYKDATASLNTDELLASFPEFLLNDEVRANIENATSEESGTALVESVTNSIANPVSDVFSNILGYALTFVLALIILSIAAWFLTKLADRITFIGKVNRILGGVWGALMGIIILFMIASVVKFLGADAPLYNDTVVVKFFGDSILLEIFKIINIGSMLG